jgi:flagellar hook-basal body complex protein FliE
VINFNANVSSMPRPFAPVGGVEKPELVSQPSGDFGKLINKYVESVDADQQSSNDAIKDLLSGKTQDINTVVAEVAKADMSFKLLVGVRNKVIEAYKQTMQMQI